MSVRFYMDENVSRSITVGLRRRGLDVLTVSQYRKMGDRARPTKSYSTALRSSVEFCSRKMTTYS